MKNQFSNNLKEELKLAGASDSEAGALMAVASELGQLKNSRDQQQSRRRTFTLVGITSMTGLALGVALVMLSQTVLPGSLLYPVQKFSDNVSVATDPTYRGTVMMKRAQEVKQLIAEHANSNTVLTTLADYQTEASAYKSAPANYAVFEYCKANLRQAAARAPGPERQAINETLLSLQST